MVKCPKCNTQLPLKSKLCPKCGAVISEQKGVGSSDTLDVVQHFDGAKPDELKIGEPLSAGAPDATLIPASGQTHPAREPDDGLGTVDSDTPLVPLGERAGEPAQVSGMGSSGTLDAIENARMDALEEDPNATVNAVSGAATVHAAASPHDTVGETTPVQAVDPNATTDSVADNGPVNSANAADKTLATDPNATVDSVSGMATVRPVEPPSDDAATTLPPDDAEGGTDSKRGKSGSEGRLRRLWEGAAGSSHNPMHSLKAEAQATGSVFKRVATRTLSDAAGKEGEEADYQLIQKLGEGAMGIVFAARQKAIDRVVALKAIKQSQQSNEDSRRKFFYEAQITGELDHPNIVPIHELGSSQQGLLFYSMKNVVGTSWQKEMPQKSREENVEILMKVADAVAFAHSKGVIHRDLKPENIMLGTYGEVLVMDWGLAVSFRRKQEFGLGGTPAYMAPEMASHDVSKIGPQSDIYLLGAMLFQIITGLPPHPGQTVTQVLRAALNNQMIPVAQPDSLLDIANKAMAKEIEDRYTTVAEMQEAIRLYRRHAESITLTKRADEQLKQATQSQDYQAFSRALFGFRDAADLWPDNPNAGEGIKRCRMAYASCAFDRADYDLCLQTLDRTVPEEEKMYLAAEKEKAAALNREKRVKQLRRTVTAVVLGALVGMSGLSSYAWWQRGVAITNAAEAKKQEGIATEKSVEAQRQEAIAKTEAMNARNAEALAREEEQKAIAARISEEDAKMLAQKERDDAVKARTAEELARKVAEAATEKERQAKEAETQALAEVSRKAAEVQLGNFQSNLSLALAQLAQFDTSKSIQSLNAAKLSLDSPLFEKMKPRLDTWVSRRISLLGNSDLPKIDVGNYVTAIDFSPTAKLGVLGTRDGKVELFEFDGQGLRALSDRSLKYSSQVDATAISPDGKTVIFSLNTPGQANTVFVWRTDEPKPAELKATNQRSLQGFAITADGKRIVGGVNGGLWVWMRSGANDMQWLSDPAPKKYEKVKGRLKSIQLIGGNQDKGIVVTDFNGSLACYEIDFRSDASRLIFPSGPTATNATQTPIRPATVALPTAKITSIAHAAVSEKLLLGTETGQIFVADLDANATVTKISELLPKMHQSAVRSIRVHPTQGALLTTGIEPVVHVWERASRDIGWQYNTFLIGTEGNVESTLFGSDTNHVLGVDENGRMLAWNVQRQKQRRQLKPTAPDGSDFAFAAPVLSAAPTIDGKTAVAVDANGVLNQWSLEDGRTIPLSENSQVNYFGHTPGARFVDMAVDLKAKILVTAAALPAQNRNYVSDEKANAEICVWNLGSGAMTRRWTLPTLSEPRISLLDAGKSLLIASDSNTTIRSLEKNLAPVFDRDNFGAYIAIAHPKTSGLVMLVNRSRAVRAFQLGNERTWEDPGYRELKLADNTDPPVQAAWSPSGDMFYMVFASGKISKMSWSGNKIGPPQVTDFSEPLGFASIRPQSWRDLDLQIKADGGIDTLYIAARLPGISANTSYATLQFSKPNEKPTVKLHHVVGRQWLVNRTPQATPQVLASARSIQKLVTANGNSFVATIDAGVYRIQYQPVKSVSVFARKPILAASSNLAGNRIVTLQQDHSLWLASLAPGKPVVWSPILSEGIDTTGVRLSPDGAQLLLLGESNDQFHARTIDPISGKVLKELPGVQLGDWSGAGELATYSKSGEISVVSANGGETFNLSLTQPTTPGTLCKQMKFFSEAWSSGQPPRRYLAVVTETDTEDALEFLKIDKAQRLPAPLRQIFPKGSVTALATSPNESLFVVGDRSGTVSVWFTTPTYDKNLHQLFTLDGHRGAKVESLTFTADGHTLISTDNQNRLFGWLSADSLNRNSAKLKEGNRLVRTQD